MSAVGQIFFVPLIPWSVLVVLAVGAFTLLGIAIWRGLSGWFYRAAALAILLAALSGPTLQDETRDPLPDILLALVDESASQDLPGRPEARDAALAWLTEVSAALGAELKVVSFPDAAGGKGTELGPILDRALAELPVGQLAGVYLLSDGGIHDASALVPRLAGLPAPMHLLRSGSDAEWDRRLTILNAPRFAVTGEEIVLQLRVDALGAAPNAPAELSLSVDGSPPSRHAVRVGQDLELPLVLDHAGETVVHLTLTPLEGELTDRNNQAAVRINGIRDRLRVLLVSGEPHPGTRTWRNLLKSDASVDLVHFTILRPPDKRDGVPVNELSLIPFPTQDLFIDKIDEFDLIIFDRYRLRGILPGAYLSSVRNYVERGGAVLVAAGPEFASVESLSRSPLGEVLPLRPSGRVNVDPMRPELTDTGLRHPVTKSLMAQGEQDHLGAWLRHVELESVASQVVMQSPAGDPLLALDRVGEGRVALIGTDQVWLWGRGFDGGGPQLELLRRLAHWMMGEPELEEEALGTTEDADGSILITRQTLEDAPGPLEVETPDGRRMILPMQHDGPGRFVARLAENEGQGPRAEQDETDGSDDPLPMGVYRFTQGGRSVVAVRGEAAPLEFADPLARNSPMAEVLAPTRGGVWELENGLPRLRAVQEGRPAIGRGWVGYVPREAYLSRDLRVRPALPAWIWLLVVAGAVVLAWWVEGRRAEQGAL
ncbi:hypothetical protein [Aliiroseovarius crassostreae]|uniref:hypothetical protein n=1 Tax=Aliiroseovarius crassostreae TaxID=154981 RepID=UPI003C7CA03E